MMRVREIVKAALPAGIRRVLRAGLHYAQRNFRWLVILWQVRGVSWRDQAVLLRSAVAAPLLSFKDLLVWQDPVLLKDVSVYVPGVGQFCVRAHTDDLWHVLPWRERSIFNVMRSVLRPGDVFVDIGANIGVYTVFASRLVGKLGRVLAIEMMPETASRLEKHVQMNGLENVEVFRCALSDTRGQKVRATVQPGKFGQATIAVDSERYGFGSAVDVETETLDQLVAAAGVQGARMIKIDVEGAEIQVLRGGLGCLGKAEYVVYERWGWRRQESSDVDRLLEGAGFMLASLDGNNCLAHREGVQ